MPLKVKTCAFVVSHPRSGTHLMLDFVRRNFRNFNPPLMPWESSAKLFADADGPHWRQSASRIVETGHAHLLVKTHRAGFTNQNDVELRRVFNPEHVVYLYPFRKFSETVRSFAEFLQYDEPISRLLDEPDAFFGRSATVGDCLREHAQSWLERPAHFLDCDRLLGDPETASARLAPLLNETPAPLKRRLPGKKIYQGKLGELMERLTGRQSTEVVIPYQLRWQDKAEQDAVDSRFADLYAELSTRRVN